MRVVVFGPTHPFKGGIAQHTTTLAHRLSGRGADVRILSWSRPYPERLYPGQLTVAEPEIREFPAVDRALAWNRPDSWIRAGRRARGADVAVFAQVVPVQAIPYRAVMFSLGRGPKVAVVCHNVLPHERHPGDRRLVSDLLRRSDRVLVHSGSEAGVASELIGDGGCSRVVTASLPPHFPDSFAPRTPRPGVHRRLLFFGIVRPYKGLDVLLRALARGPADIELRVAGEVWGGTASWERLCADLGLARRVEFLSRYIDASEVPGLFEDVDALVLPYRSATGSQGVWTGFQFGVPVIATATGELASALRPGTDGLVVEPDDVAGLADAIDALYRPGRAEELRSKVEPADMGTLWDAYLERLLGGLLG